MSSELTVVVPVWGAGRMECVRTVLESLLCQSAAPEVVLAEAGPEPLWQEYAESIGVRYVQAPLRSHETGERFSPGGTRNAGLLAVDTPWTLFSDGDVLLPMATDLEQRLEIVKGHGECFGMFGAMRHMHPDGVARLVESGCWTPTTEPLPDARVLDFRDGRLLPARDESMGLPPGLSGRTEPQRPADAPPYRGRGLAGMFWALPYQFSGLLVPTELVRRLGGFCEQYVDWGSEDEDLIWKLQARARSIVLCEKLPDIYSIHLSHDRSGFSRINFERNLLLFHIRRGEGIEAAVKADVDALAASVASVEGG